MYSYNSPKTYTSNQPKTYTYTPPKTNIGEYKTLGGYTNTNPYVTKDMVGNGQNSYSAQPKSQVKNDYTGVKNQNAVDELWNRYYTELAGKKETQQPQKLTKTTEPKQQNTNTVKAGKSTINIRDDGSTIHYDSDTAIDLFDFLDFLSGRYGPNNEMAESVKIAKEISEIPDLIAKAQPKNNLENPVLQYEDMIRKPDALYGINADEWIANAPENWEDTYKDKLLYKMFGEWGYNNIIATYIDGLKTAEKEILLENPVKSAYLFLNRDNLKGAKDMATALRDKVYVYNENELDAVKPYTVEEANIDGSIPNALLHTTWSAFLTYDFGEDFAREITTAHEMLDKEQYADDKIYSQPEIYADKANGVYSAEKAYPTLQQHMEMDLHNNALGISIAKEIKQMTDDEVREELEYYYYQSGDDEEYFDKMYPELKDDRKRLMFIVCLKAVQYGYAAIIWDKYGDQIGG